MLNVCDMKKAFLFVAVSGFLLLHFRVDAQRVAVGARGGVSIPNLTAGSGNENPLNTGYSSRVGPDAGVFMEFRCSRVFSVQPMIEFSSQGGKKNGLQALPTPPEAAPLFPAGQAPTYLYADFNSEARLNYLMIPVLAKFGWDIRHSPLRVYVDGGPFLGLLLSAHQVTSGQSALFLDPEGQQALPSGSQSFDNKEDIKDQLHTVNVGAEANVGLDLKMGRSNVFIEGGGNFGFLNIQKGTANGKNHTGAALIAVGYELWLDK